MSNISSSYVREALFTYSIWGTGSGTWPEFLSDRIPSFYGIVSVETVIEYLPIYRIHVLKKKRVHIFMHFFPFAHKRKAVEITREPRRFDVAGFNFSP